ncbi:hypothetical protein G5C66_06340 [Nocardioides sp. KC13]|uniref:Uncharacterized protein n=1 Tax=Nocardioides turkmenicus TaxID=2711220 RepID=A0A6M1QXG1_9ACTN|nr:hypothetical protein [Nocardioides sp. KC13]NGN92360.1 hypothetical protein [Nocardioides sp. KC13]
MESSGTKTADKSDVIKAAVAALQDVRGRITTAMREHARLEATLPASHGAAPNPSDPKYAQSGTGVDGAQAAENQKALQADRAAHAAREAAIAEAERIAAQHVQDVDTSVDEAEPKVRALYDDGSSSDPVPAGSSGSPGSASQVAAAQARMAKYNSGTLYPEGWGHELIAQEKANIEAAKAENTPEWDGTQWINADGTPAPATSYAMVETADGLAPLAGGTGGMSALALAGGGALLGAGVAKAVASKFAAGASAKAGSAGATSRSAAARSAAARAGAASARAGAGAAGAGARGAGARAAGAGARATGAGARATGAGARGAGAGAGRGAAARGAAAGRGGMGAAAGRGGKKRDQNGSQSQEWEADYTEDWTETASDVLDPNASRGWVPDATEANDKSEDKNRRG